MIVVIIGAGEIGRSLADYMLKRKHDVTVIDSSDEKCKACAREVAGAIVFHGDSVDEDILRHANIASADVLVITPVNDELSVKTAEVAKRVFGVPHIISMMDHDNNLGRLKEAGVDIAISQTKAVLQSFESALDRAKSQTLHISQQEGLKLVRIEIGIDYEVIGWKAADLKMPKECLLMSVTKKGYPAIVPPEHIIQAHDVFYLFGASGSVEEMREMMTRSGTS